MDGKHSRLIQLLSLNSYTDNKKGVDQKLDLIYRWLKDLPMRWYREKSKKYGDLRYAKTEFKKGLPRIGIVLHIDTVHREQDIFPIKLIGNRLFGPGAQDMQGSIFTIVNVLEKLNDINKLYNLTIIFNTNEEKGSPEFQELTREIAKQLDYLMVFESAASIDKYADKEFIITDSRKGTFQQVIDVFGPGGHTGQLTKKEERVNAITQAVKMIDSIQSLEDYDKETTIGMLYVNGGKENTVLADHCRFVFDVRYRHQTEYDRVIEGIEKIMNTKYEVGTRVEDGGYNYNLPALPPNEKSKSFGEEIKNLANDLGINLQIEKRGGWSDACNYYKYNPNLHVIDGLGPQGGGEHTKNEFVYLDSIKVMQELSINIISDLLK